MPTPLTIVLAICQGPLRLLPFRGQVRDDLAPVWHAGLLGPIARFILETVMYRLICPCGQEITVRGSQAGCQLTCDCGKTFRIPALSELMVYQERNEAAPVVDLPQFGGHDVTLEQMPTTAGAAFAFPIGDGRFSVCRVLLDPSSHGQRGESLDFMTGVLDGRRKHNILVACSKWIVNRIRRADDPDLFMTRYLDSRRKNNILVACSNWIGNRIPRADDPALRTILHLNHHSYVDQQEVLWISWTEDLPEDFIYIGTIVPSAKELEINCNLSGSWSSITCQPLTQWRWDNDRDALLADEAKQAEYRRARLILDDSGVVIDSQGLMHRDVRLAWHQVREVAVEGSDTEHSDVPYLAITSDTGEFTIRQGIKAFPAIVNALDGLPEFPSLEFRKSLNSSMFCGKEIVWRRDFTELDADLKLS